jgi:hypothetical protein
MSRLRRISIVLVLQITIASAALASRYVPPNVRPFFDAGYCEPVEFDSIDQGFGFGGGLELESTRHLSVLFRFEYQMLEAPDRGSLEYGYSSGNEAFVSTSWSIGGRAYLTRRGLRPYAELDYGIRLRSDRPTYYYSPALAYGDVQGMIGTARLGLSAARFHGGGLFFEAGYEGLLHNFDQFAIVPVRLGVVFP